MIPDVRVPLTVFFLEDNELVRRALVDALASETDIRVVGEASTARRALEAIPRLHPDVAILDVHLPDGNGIDVCRTLHAEEPDVRCLILTAHAAGGDVEEALDAGAAGFLIKNLRGLGLAGAIRDAAAGLVVVDPAARIQRGPGGRWARVD